MRAPWTLLLATLALTACERRTEIPIQINGWDRDLVGFVYRGAIADCSSPERLFASGSAPGGALTQIEISSGDFAGPELAEGEYTLALVAVEGCDVVAAGCQRFLLPDDGIVRVDVIEQTSVRWCGDGCSCVGGDAGPRFDAGAPTPCMGGNGTTCDLGAGATGICCDGSCGIGQCCNVVGAACESNSVCCDSNRCLPYATCGCDRLPDMSQCSEAGAAGVCQDGTCVTAPPACLCTPPLECTDAQDGCTLTIDTADLSGGEYFDLVWYQLSRSDGPFEQPLGMATQNQGLMSQRVTFGLTESPPEPARFCDRAGASCPEGRCDCDGTLPTLALAALAAGSAGSGTALALPPQGVAPDLLVVWASARIDGDVVSRDAALSRFGVVPGLFVEPIPQGYSVWRRATMGAEAFELVAAPGATATVASCGSCSWPLPPR